MGLRGPSNETIAAIATPLGEGGLGVIRVSGPDALEVADRVFRARSGTKPSRQKSFTAQYGHVIDADGKTIDEALLLVMRTPKSYTREDVFELSVHAGPAVLEDVLERVLSAGARLAEPGEFTKRAFLNGRIDLVQAEAVLDLVQAKTSLARQWAASQLGGRVSSALSEAKASLVDILAHLEASVDFPDDQPDARPITEAGLKLEGWVGRFTQLLRDSEAALSAKRGARAVLIGPPNAGKSSLMNALSRTHRVIVTPYPGTTRDLVEEEVQIGGYPLRLVDTAGIRPSEHPIEREGIERSRKAATGADILLCVLDGSHDVSEEELELFRDFRDKKRLFILNKSDLGRKTSIDRLGLAEGEVWVEASCAHDNGILELENEIVRMIQAGVAGMGAVGIGTSARQKDALSKIAAHLSDAASACGRGVSAECVAVDVRAALDELGALAGEVVTEDVLDAVFSRFCIGK